jgi:hypothetical protein
VLLLLIHRNEFEETYRMELESLNLLVDTLREDLTFDIAKALSSASNMEPIYPELVCAVGLRLLAGGKRNDIKDWANMSRSSFSGCRDTFLDAVLHAPSLDIKFPQGAQKLKEAAYGFERLSSPQGTPMFNKCIGCVDGMLIHIIQPKEVENPGAYFSGHYHLMATII